MIIVVKKKSVFILTLITMLSFMTTSLIYSAIRTNNGSIGNVIIIDPGHGGRDPGALGRVGKHEKDINLDISKKLKAVLEQKGYAVVLTRDEDESIHDEGAKRKKASELKNRKKIIDETNPRLVVSIHLNSFPQQQYYGAQVFYPPKDAESKKLGETIQTELKNMVNPSNDRVAKPISTAVLLKGLDVPAVIVECGFLSNEAEEKALNTEEHQNKLANAIFSGVDKYLQSVYLNPPNQ